MKPFRKYIRSSVVVTFFLFAVTPRLEAQYKQEVKPTKFVNLVPMVGDSDFVYYALSEKSKTTIEVQGPGDLIVYNRVRLEKNQERSKPYYLKYLLDNKRIISEKIGPQTKSSKVTYKGNLKGTPSKADKITIQIPPGKHTLNFYKYKTKNKAHVRFVYEQKAKPHWIDQTPLTALEPVGITHITSKKTQNYYRIDANQGFSFSANNQQRIRVYLRADFTYKMHGNNVLRLVLKQGSSEISTYKITCQKSNKVEYANDKKHIAGALEKIYIDLPKGVDQTYELQLKEPGKSAIIRVSLDVPTKLTAISPM